MPDTYTFTGKDGTPMTFIGDRPPTDEEMAQLDRGASPTVDQSDQPSYGGTVMFAAGKAIPYIETGVKAALAAPNAPRIIQRAIGAGVRGVSTALGAAIGGVPGAVGGAAVSEGLTPTQQTVRGWLGRQAAPHATDASDAVTNYIEAMGADASNLTGAALEYAKKAGRAILYDSSGRASLVPSADAVSPVAASARAATTSSILSQAARGLSVLSGAQSALDLAQMADPTRQDIGVLGLGKSVDVSPAMKTYAATKPTQEDLLALTKLTAKQFSRVKNLVMKGQSYADAITEARSE